MVKTLIQRRMGLHSKVSPGHFAVVDGEAMLTFFCARRHRYPIETYLEAWAPDLRAQVRSMGYEDLPKSGQLEPGTYVFCDHERWSSRQHGLAVELWKQLESGGGAVCLLNDPRRVLRRYELLKKFHECGQNVFDVHRLGVALKQNGRTVFLHSLGGHEGPLSPQVDSRAALLVWIVFNSIRRPWARLTVEEFCDVSVDGIYSKYAAFHLKGVILPRHLFFGKAWAQKGVETTEEHQLDRMEAYSRGNPDELELQKIFPLAGIDYGRIDYAFYRGRLQVWEINTNPMIIGAIPGDTPPREVALAESFADKIRPEFLRLSALSREDKAVPYRLTSRF